MKKIFYIIIYLTLISIEGLAQSDNQQLIDTYTTEVDSLRKLNLFSKVQYRDMSFCGGDLNGYYKENNLINITSTYSAEAGFRTIDVYFKNNKIVKIVNYQHFAEWEKYHIKYPKGEGEFGGSYENMTYTDTTYVVHFANSTTMIKSSKGILINKLLDLNLLKSLTACSRGMIAELEEERGRKPTSENK